MLIDCLKHLKPVGIRQEERFAELTGHALTLVVHCVYLWMNRLFLEFLAALLIPE